MKKIIISLIFLITLNGCYNYHELNNYSVVTGVAIDKSKDGYEVSVLIANSPKENSDKEDGAARIVVYSGKGETIFTAIKDIGLISAKELYMGHFTVLVISEEVAREGINDTLDLFLRETSSKKNFYIAIAKDCKAKDTLKIITPLSNFPSQNISDNLTSTSQLQGIVSSINFNELLSNLETKGIESTINSINIIGNVNEGSSKENVEQSEPKTYIKLGTLGLFKGDKLIYWTNKDESVGINIIKNKTKEMNIKIVENNANIVIETTNMTTKLTPKLNNSKPTIDIAIKGEAKLVEVSNHINLKDDKTINIIKEKINNKVIKYVKDGINAGIKNNTDIFGFGNLFYKNYPNFYKDNTVIFKNNLDTINIDIDSNIIIKTKGSSQNSLEDNHD